MGVSKVIYNAKYILMKRNEPVGPRGVSKEKSLKETHKKGKLGKSEGFGEKPKVSFQSQLSALALGNQLSSGNVLSSLLYCRYTVPTPPPV
jgi:hypothetical protein